MFVPEVLELKVNVKLIDNPKLLYLFTAACNPARIFVLRAVEPVPDNPTILIVLGADTKLVVRYCSVVIPP
ncbi:hypothetical protein D3C85_1327500 [compost metagenome]